MVPHWCGQGFPWWSFLWVTYSPSPLKEQYKPFSLFFEETSICLMRYNGIINNYKLKFQKSLSLHLHHLSQVHARCLSGAHAVPIWCVCDACLAHSQCVCAMLVWPPHGARLARSRCTFSSPMVCAQCAYGSPVASSLSPWSLNHQTSRLSLLSA